MFPDDTIKRKTSTVPRSELTTMSTSAREKLAGMPRTRPASGAVNVEYSHSDEPDEQPIRQRQVEGDVPKD